MMSSDPLSQLKDIHLPPPVGWWPPAVGWWVLAGLGLVALAGAAVWLWRRHRRNRWLRLSWRELERLYGLAQSSPAFFGQLNGLLKRASRLRYPEQNTDGLSGETWIRFLQARAPQLPEGELRKLVESSWRPQPGLSPSEGLKLTGDWLRAQKC